MTNAAAIVACLFTTLLTNASAQTVSRAQLNSSFEIKYGVVANVQKVKIESQAAKGAVMGGIVGSATSGHRHRGKHAAQGALAGALLAAILEGDCKAFQYTVKFQDGGATKIITET